MLAGAEDAGSLLGSATGVIEPASRLAVGVDVAATGANSSAVGVRVESPLGSPTRGAEAVVRTGEPASGQ